MFREETKLVWQKVKDVDFYKENKPYSERHICLCSEYADNLKFGQVVNGMFITLIKETPMSYFKDYYFSYITPPKIIAVNIQKKYIESLKINLKLSEDTVKQTKEILEKEMRNI